MPSVASGSATPINITNSISASLGTLDQGQSTSFTSTVSGGFAPYVYQWYAQPPGASVGTPISGATTSSYTFVSTTSNATGNWNFILRVTDTNSSVKNASTLITLNSQLVAPTIVSTNGTLDQGQTATLSNSTPIISGTKPYTLPVVTAGTRSRLL